MYLWTGSDIDFLLCQQESLHEAVNGHDCQILDVVALHVSVCIEKCIQVEEKRIILLSGNANPRSRKIKRLDLLITKRPRLSLIQHSWLCLSCLADNISYFETKIMKFWSLFHFKLPEGNLFLC